MDDTAKAAMFAPTNKVNKKPALDKWLFVAERLVKILSKCVHVYKNKAQDLYTATEKQKKIDSVVEILQDLYSIIDRCDDIATFEDSENKIRNKEQLILKFVQLFKLALIKMPMYSEDMQKLLDTHWNAESMDHMAKELFHKFDDDPIGVESGLGSGLPKDERLPKMMNDILEEEDAGGAREEFDTEILENPLRKDKDVKERWSEQNSTPLRTAGRMN